MARVQPQQPSEDLQWEELEEAEGGGEEREGVSERGPDEGKEEDKERIKGRDSREGVVHVYTCIILLCRMQLV